MNNFSCFHCVSVSFVLFDMSIDECGVLKSINIIVWGILCALEFTWPISGRMPRLLTLKRDFRKYMFCFAASYNSLPQDDRYETTSGENQEIDYKHCGTLLLVSTSSSVARCRKNSCVSIGSRVQHVSERE